MKVPIMTLALSSLTCLSFGVEFEVQMPNEDILRERLATVGETRLAEETSIIAELAGVKKDHTEIFNIIEKSMYAYAAKSTWGEVCGSFFTAKPELVRALLQDYPQALQELKSSGKIW